MLRLLTVEPRGSNLLKKRVNKRKKKESDFLVPVNSKVFERKTYRKVYDKLYKFTESQSMVWVGAL